MSNWNWIFCSLFLISVMLTTFGLEVTMSEASIEVARGKDVTLTCNFKSNLPKKDLIIVTWTGDSTGDDTTEKRIFFGSHYSNPLKVDIDPQYAGKASIEASDQSSALTLKQVTLKESRNIRCYVQIPGDNEGKTSDATSLLVQIAPSKPVCKVVGTAEYGHNISLTCASEEGSPTPTYKWERYDVKNVPQAFPIKTTEKNGVLSLVNVSMETSGYYICQSTNKIGLEKCNMTLSVTPGSMNLATIGIAAGCIAGAVVLIIIIVCCCRKRKQKPKEYQMEGPEVEYHDKPEIEYSEEGNIHNKVSEARSDDLKNQNDDRRSSRDELKDQHDDNGSGRDDLRDRYDDRRGSRDELRDRYDDRRGSRDELRDRYDDRKGSRDDLRDRYDDRRDRYDDRKGSRDDLRDRYDDRKGSRDDLRDRYDDRKGSRDDLRDRYDDRRDHYDERRGSRDDLRDQYDDRRDRYDDQRDRYR